MKHINVMVTEDEEKKIDLWIKAVRAAGEAVYWACKLPFKRETSQYKSIIWLQGYPLASIKKREVLYKWSKTEMIRRLSDMASISFEAFHREYSVGYVKNIFLYAVLSTLRYLQSYNDDNTADMVKDFNSVQMLKKIIELAKQDKQTLRNIYDKAVAKELPEDTSQLFLDSKFHLFRLSANVFDRSLHDPRIIIAL